MKKFATILIGMLLILTTFVGCTAEETNYITLDDDTYDMSKSEYKDACKKIKYKDFRYETKYMEEHKKIKCKGQVVQICNEQDSESNYYSEYRVAITKEKWGDGDYTYTDDIYVYYMLEDNPKLFEDDIVTLYGEVTDSVTFTTRLDIERTVPAMVAVYVDIKD